MFGAERTYIGYRFSCALFHHVQLEKIHSLTADTRHDILRAVRRERCHSNPKCKRGNGLTPSLTLRVGVPSGRVQYKSYDRAARGVFLQITIDTTLYPFRPALRLITVTDKPVNRQGLRKPDGTFDLDGSLARQIKSSPGSRVIFCHRWPGTWHRRAA